MVKQHLRHSAWEEKFLSMSHEFPSQDIAALAIRNELHQTIDACMKRSLSYRERSVVELRMQDETLEEVACKFKVTRERIRQIEGKAIRKLKDPGVARDLFEFLD